MGSCLASNRPPLDDVRESLNAVLAYSKDHSYSGYSKFDALNSPLLETVFGGSYLGRLCITQLVNRSYIPLRPVFGVRTSRNPKGVANFIKSYCLLHKIHRDADALAQAVVLGDWLLENQSPDQGYSGMGWGYNFPWQSPGFFAKRHSPNCIVTIFCAEAMLALYGRTGNSKYLDAALGASTFLLNDLPVLEENEEVKCIGYVAGDLRWKVININAVAAGFLSKLSLAAGRKDLLRQAGKMIAWTLANRTSDYAWHYTVPPSASGIGHDNYHTGGILDGILDYMQISREDWPREAFEKGLAFYSNHLFEPDGAPRWTSKRAYPQDIHGSAQGIITFSRAAVLYPEYIETSIKIASWALANMQAPDGHFYYRKHRCFTRRECLMRWNNSWMSWALAVMLDHLWSLAA